VRANGTVHPSLPGVFWANIAFTDGMSIEIGGSFGVSLVWRGNDEKWDQTCVGATKKRCPTPMCWGMIGWNYKVNHYRYSLPVSRLIRCRVLSISGAPRQTKSGKTPFARSLFSTTFGRKH